MTPHERRLEAKINKQACDIAYLTGWKKEAERGIAKMHKQIEALEFASGLRAEEEYRG